MTVASSLILTADDFGFGPALNAAVVRAHREGPLRFASLMVEGEAVQEAVRLAKENPGLGVGLHLVLCLSQPELWGLRYFFSPAHRRRVEPEIRRQLEKFLSFGLTPTHADGHINIHVHPVIFPALARLCREYKVPRVRLPGGEWRACRGYGGGGLALRAVNAAVFGLLRAYLRPQGLAQGLEIPERTFGLLRSGLMSEDYVLRLLDGLEEAQGEAELYFHPSADPASRVADRPTPTHHTIVELEALLSPRVRRRLEGLALRLRSPAEGRPCAS